MSTPVAVAASARATTALPASFQALVTRGLPTEMTWSAFSLVAQPINFLCHRSIENLAL
jgi:hypothetical protein